MPKIEIDKKAFYEQLKEKPSNDKLEQDLVCAKAELDDDMVEDGILKIELNDTNRPDLWSTAGLVRQMKLYKGMEIPTYGFFSDSNTRKTGEKEVQVDAGLKDIRPYIAAFAVSGKPLDSAMLNDIIQTQEKLCWNYGNKRESVAMGVYRSDLFTYPVQYKAADPDKTKFVPLNMENELSLREILTKHPKGEEFGYIVSELPKFPYITDANGDTLSFPPIINSAKIGAVEEGDTNLFIELTGTDIYSLLHTANIVACDFADFGYTVQPVKISYPYDTPLGREIITPYYFQKPVTVELDYVNRMLGTDFSLAAAQERLCKMGCKAKIEGTKLTVTPPEYRNDFMHPVDIVEDIMIGHGMDNFEPIMPTDFTVGRVSPVEKFSRELKDIMIGMGYQEMIYNYLGSGKDYIEKMNITGEDIIQIANPMTENYQYVRNSALPGLLSSESISGHAVYPHKIFEIGKAVFRSPQNNYGADTYTLLSFLTADREADFNQISSQISAVFYYMALIYELEEAEDPRFIPGRAARVLFNKNPIGIFGEIHPQVLENWGIDMPCIAGEIMLEPIIKNR